MKLVPFPILVSAFLVLFASGPAGAGSSGHRLLPDFTKLENLRPVGIPPMVWEILKPSNQVSTIDRPQTRLEDRAAGSLLGLAIGDALGVTHEIFEPNQVTRQREFLRTEPIGMMMGNGPWVRGGLILEPGEFTDDTSMALCLADSMLKLGKQTNPFNGAGTLAFGQDLMLRFYCWSKGDCNAPRHSLDSHSNRLMGHSWGIGGNTRSALHRFAMSEFLNPWVGGRDPHQDAGNGAIMRMAPAALYWSDHRDLAMGMARVQARLTHHVPEAEDAAAYMASVIVRSLQGNLSKELVFSPQGVQIHHEEIFSVVSRSLDEWKVIPESEIQTLPGRTLWTLEAALWCIHTTDTFRDAVLKALSLGGDADTVAAVTGQLAGAFYGKQAIPMDWLDALKFKSQIEKRAIALVRRLPFTKDLLLTYGYQPGPKGPGDQGHGGQ